VLVQITQGLEDAHGVGFVHGDLHLDNVLLFPGPLTPGNLVVSICDWGSSRRIGTPQDCYLHAIRDGSYSQNGPERYRANAHYYADIAADSKWDSWSVSMLALELALGAIPNVVWWGQGLATGASVAGGQGDAGLDQQGEWHVVLCNGWTCPVARLPINPHVKVLVTSGLHWDVHARASVSEQHDLCMPSSSSHLQ
jgi:serine/threonine protein kinase